MLEWLLLGAALATGLAVGLSIDPTTGLRREATMSEHVRWSDIRDEKVDAIEDLAERLGVIKPRPHHGWWWFAAAVVAMELLVLLAAAHALRACRETDD